MFDCFVLFHFYYLFKVLLDATVFLMASCSFSQPSHLAVVPIGLHSQRIEPTPCGGWPSSAALQPALTYSTSVVSSLSSSLCAIQDGRDIPRPFIYLASRRDGEQDWEAGRGGPRGAGGEDGRQPREELHRAGAKGAGEPAVPLPQVPGGRFMLQ